MKDSDVELVELRRRIAKLKQEARTNEDTWRRSQQREMSLLEAQDLPALLSELTLGLRHSYGLQSCRLHLIDPEHEVRHLLGNAGMNPDQFDSVHFIDSTDALPVMFRTRTQPWLGRYDTGMHAALFGPDGRLGSVAVLPLSRQSSLVGCLCFGSRESGRFTAEHGTDFLHHLGIIAAFCLENVTNRARLLRQGFTDVLTGWNNRRYLDARLDEEIARSRRNRTTLACMLVDVDHFKQVNDNHGHTAGDEVLREVARRIAAEVRGSDISARYGGEEFVILMPRTTLDAGRVVAERIRAAVAAKPFGGSALPAPVPVTVSIGLARIDGADDALSPEQAVLALIAAADRALYAAKAAGRNAVSVQQNGRTSG